MGVCIRQENRPVCARNIPLLAFGWDGVDAVPEHATTHNAAVASARHIAVALRRWAVLPIVVAAEASITGLDSEELEAGALRGARDGRHITGTRPVPHTAFLSAVVIAIPAVGSIRAKPHRQVPWASILVTRNVHRSTSPQRRAVGGDIREARWQKRGGEGEGEGLHRADIAELYPVSQSPW